MTSLIDILNEWQTNLKFREEFKKDPENALNEAGFTLSPKDLKKIKSVRKLWLLGLNYTELFLGFCIITLARIKTHLNETHNGIKNY